MTRFEEYFGQTKKTALETTFRIPYSLARFSSTFVLKNDAQIRKSLSSRKRDDRPPVMIYFTDGKEDPLPQVLHHIAEEGGRRRGQCSS